VNQIIRYGKVVKPTVGVNVAEDRVLRSIEMQLKKELNGALVVEVVQGSPAEKAGMKATTLRSDGVLELGDLITEINGEKIVCVEDLLAAIEAHSEGETVNVTLWRTCDRQQSETLPVKLTSSDKLMNGLSSKKSAWQ
jgi:S1-C subfamily serine protease